TVNITVVRPNHAPQAFGQSIITEFGAAIPVTLSGSDPDGDAITYVVGNGPAHGLLSGDAPALTYTPAATIVGSDSFTFTVSDGRLTSPTATVNITVNSSSSPPLPPGS